MTKTTLENLIRLVVEETIKEDHPQRLRDIFLQPAKDVIQTANYAAERLSGAAQTLIKGLAYIIPTILIPGLEFNYDLFKKDEDLKMAEIKKKYGDVLARNWEAIKDPDVFGFLFLAYPQAMLGFAALKKSPLAFLRLLEVVTGGMDSVTAMRQSVEQSAAYTPRQTQNYDPNHGPFGGGPGGNDSSYMGDMYGDYAGTGLTGESKTTKKNLIEAQENPQLLQQVQALMQRPEVKQAIAASPIMKDMQRASVDIMTAPVQRFMQVQNLDQMKGFIEPGKVDQAKAEFQKKSGTADPNAQQQAMAELVKEMKKSYKEAYVKQLLGLAQKDPQTKPAIDTAIARIRGL